MNMCMYLYLYLTLYCPSSWSSGIEQRLNSCYFLVQITVFVVSEELLFYLLVAFIKL